MNELHQEWIKALLGDYNQTKLNLKDEDGFCCLGVLCDISGLGEWKGKTYIVDGEESYGNLTPELCKKFNLTKSQMESFAALNDDYRYSFKDIAKLIHQMKDELEPGDVVMHEGTKYIYVGSNDNLCNILSPEEQFIHSVYRNELLKLNEVLEFVK